MDPLEQERLRREMETEYVSFAGLRIETAMLYRLAQEIRAGRRKEAHVLFSVNEDGRLHVTRTLCDLPGAEVISWNIGMATAPNHFLCLLVRNEEEGLPPLSGFGFWSDEKLAWMVIFGGEVPIPIKQERILAWAWPPTGPNNSRQGY